jgi:hypothetical protein
MTLITFENGKPVFRNGKVGAAQGCCCGGGTPGCCVHYCNRLCCNEIAFAYAFSSGCGGSSGIVTVSVGTDCYAGYTLTYGECSVTFRVKITCDGYNADQNCDTDCTVSAIEYLDGSEWTETMPSVLASLTAEFGCEQAEAQYGTPRCAGNIAVADQAACDTLEGVYCPENPEPCSQCGFVCPSDPTEWRMVDQDGVVWFAGDIVVNPAYTGGDLCLDWWEAPQPARLVLQNYPNDGWNESILRWPAAWFSTSPSTMYVEVLGCDGANWKRIHIPDYCFNAGSEWSSPFPPVGTAGQICALLGNSTSYALIDDYFRSSAPPGCACAIDPGTNARVTFTPLWGYGECCRQCNALLTSSHGSGLEYLGHGQAVRFTGAVDYEGSNLANWEDADGNSPAGWLPTENGWNGTRKTTSSIVIEGELRGWRNAVGRDFDGAIEFASVTLEPGAVLAVSLKTQTLTVDDATIEASPADFCLNPDTFDVIVTVTGTATFKNGAVNNATGFGPLNVPGVIGNCVFEDGSQNAGVIAGNVTLADTASNTGTIVGNVTASGSATVGGTVDGDATLSGSAQLTGDVTGTATFAGSACNSGGTAGTFDPDPPPAC